MKISQITAVCCLLLLVVGCGDDSKPSHKVALQQIQQGIASNLSPEVFRTSDFVYQNGYNKGDGSYVVSATYKLTFLKSLSDLDRQVSKQVDLAAANNRVRAGSDMSPMAGIMDVFAFKLAFGDFVAGTSRQMNGNYIFRKTEMGWTLAGPATGQ